MAGSWRACGASAPPKAVTVPTHYATINLELCE